MSNSSIVSANTTFPMGTVAFDMIQQTTANADCSVLNNNPVVAGIYHVALHLNPAEFAANKSVTAQLFQVIGNSPPTAANPLVPGQMITASSSDTQGIATITFEIPQSQIYLLNFNPPGCSAGDVSCEMQLQVFRDVINPLYGMMPINGDVDFDSVNATLLSQNGFATATY